MANLSFFSEADLILTNSLWDGGLWIGEGQVTINGEMTLQEYDSDDIIIYGKTITVNGHLVIASPNIIGGENAQIFISKGATADFQGQLGYSPTEDTPSNLTLVNEGTISISFTDDGVNTGPVEIVNRGTLGLGNATNTFDITLYTFDSTPQFQFNQASQFWLEDTSNLLVKIFGADPGDGEDTYSSNDQYDASNTDICKLGGNLTVTFISQLADCSPSCSVFTPSVGDTFRIIIQSSGADISDGSGYPCYGQFENIFVKGLDASKTVGVYFNDQSNDDLSYVSVVVCASTSATCGDLANANLPPPAATAGTGANPSSYINTVTSSSNSGSGSGSNSGTGTNTGSGSDTGSGTGTGTATHSGTGSDSGSGTGTRTGTSTSNSTKSTSPNNVSILASSMVTLILTMFMLN